MTTDAIQPVAWRVSMGTTADHNYWHYFSKKPKAIDDGEIWEPLYSASTLESLQRENEELRKRGDGAANMARQMASDCSNAQKSLAELRSAIGPINALLAHLLSMSVYHISNPPTPDWEFVQVCNGDLRKMIELSDAAEYALASTGGEHHAE
ncbi:hypothetical protein [Agrobacterium tumefaciens]|uniref:hypothetical protein n=1 Tax=Agrobacterium tumefaciens TaxID=358 RepID=UPI0021D3A90B|nr:hypothetical protein [Agrobacterium tumefaciens]UXS01681.1 hypothetical protein FY156_09480 [Agrobacterium tumefaciens]